MSSVFAQKVTVKAKRKELKLVFDEGDEVVLGIKKALEENKITEAELKDVNGVFRKLKLSYFDCGKFNSKIFENVSPLRISGNIKLSFGDLYGSMHLSMNPKNPITGTILSGIASQGLEIILNFSELIE